MSVKYGVILSYWLIPSNTSRCNTIMFYSINSDNYIMDITNLLVKIGKKNLGKIRLSGNQKSESKFLGTHIRITEKFRFGYGSPFYQPEILGTRT